MILVILKNKRSYNKDSITGIFGGRRDAFGFSPIKNEETFKIWRSRLEDALKKLAGKAAEELIAIFGSVVGAISSFLGKAFGFVGKQTWALIIFAAGFVLCWCKQKGKGDAKKKTYKNEKEKQTKIVLG